MNADEILNTHPLPPYTMLALGSRRAWLCDLGSEKLFRA